MAKKTKVGTKQMSLKDSQLKDTHELFDKYFEEWRFLNAAYEGIRALIAYGAMYQHERESDTNYTRRQKVSYGFGYSKSVVDIFNSYLFKKEFPKELPKALVNDEQWQAFQKDCNLDGSTFADFFIDEQRNASILGHVGLLVDKPATESENRADEKDQNIYPYVVAYKPMAILDWEYERDADSGRRVLSRLKVLDDDGYYRIWTRETWEIWRLQSAEGGKDSRVNLKAVTAIGEQPTEAEVAGKGITANLVDSGDNPLGEIPWVWLFNQRSNIDKEVGISDIVDVARIDASIIRNLSQIEEVIDYAAFPMMRKPMPEKGVAVDLKDETGVTAVLEFDPEHPDSKPDWLEAKVGDPVNAILKLIAVKVGEVYRASNIGGMTATEISKAAKSGIALKTEFQLLNSKLVKKGKNVSNAKTKVVEFWLRWQDEWDKYKKDIQFNHLLSFEVEDLANDLENILTSTVMVVNSPGYKKEIQKLIVRMVLPTIDEKILALIDKEIEDNVDKEIEDEEKAKALFYAQGNEPPPGNVGEEDEVDENGNPIEKEPEPKISKKGKIVNLPTKKG